MVKLVFHTQTLGAISLDYLQQVIAVGSDPGNDLVLPHPSVRPTHCHIEFREDGLRVRPVLDAAANSEVNGAGEMQFAVGQRISIGDVVFEVQHSNNTSVAIPDYQAPLENPYEGFGPLYFCEHCQASYPESTLTRIGLVGRPKHLLCPRCSREVGLVSGAAPRGGIIARLKRSLAYLARRITKRR